MVANRLVRFIVELQVRIIQRFRFASCTILLASLGSQYAAHASINFRRFSRASLRRYACSALSPITCASAVSVISRGKLETLPAQSRKLESAFETCRILQGMSASGGKAEVTRTFLNCG